jgi:hypothetical protein
MDYFSGAVTVFAWGLGAFVVFIVLLIAQFYEETSGQKTNYRLFLVPLILFVAGMARQLTVGHIAGDALAGVLWFVGAVVQVVLCVLLYRQMTQG